ncbi:MAG TPA: DUF5681 domain-containing protein [Candidatus Sulfotelmatobacter sp.]
MRRGPAKGTHVSPATEFKPGQSGHPGGRPRVKPISDALRTLLEKKVEEYEKFKPATQAEKLAQRMIDDSAGGNTACMRETLDRTEGKVPLPIIGGDEPLEVNVRVIHIGAGAKSRHRPAAPAD